MGPGVSRFTPPQLNSYNTWWPNWLHGKASTVNPRGSKRCCSSRNWVKSRLVVPQSEATLETSSTRPRNEPSSMGSEAPRGRTSSPASPAREDAAISPAEKQLRRQRRSAAFHDSQQTPPTRPPLSRKSFETESLPNRLPSDGGA